MRIQKFPAKNRFVHCILSARDIYTHLTIFFLIMGPLSLSLSLSLSLAFFRSLYLSFFLSLSLSLLFQIIFFIFSTHVLIFPKSLKKIIFPPHPKSSIFSPSSYYAYFFRHKSFTSVPDAYFKPSNHGAGLENTANSVQITIKQF